VAQTARRILDDLREEIDKSLEAEYARREEVAGRISRIP
jgi:hypothetical protein